MTVYAPTKRRSMNIPVEPAVYYCFGLTKVSGGGTFYYECPWDNVKLVYADLTVTTTIATTALTVSVTDGTTTGFTVATGTTTAAGTQVDGTYAATIKFSQGDTITLTTNDQTDAGEVAVRLFFESDT